MEYTLELTKQNNTIAVLGKYDLKTAQKLKQVLSNEEYNFKSIEIWNDNYVKVE